MDNLNEATIFLSNDGKILRSEINGALSGLVADTNAIDVVSQALLYNKYNVDLLNGATKFLKGKFSPVYQSNIYENSISIKGVKVETFYFDIWGVYSGRLYYIRFLVSKVLIKIIYMKEIEFSSIQIPSDVIKYAINIANPDFGLSFKRHSISTVLRGSGYRENSIFNNRIMSYCASKYPSITVRTKGIGIQNTIEFIYQ